MNSNSSKAVDRTDPRVVPVEVAKTLPPAERYEYFERVRISHPKLSVAMREIEHLLYPTPGANLVLLVGPPGVGKSMLIDLLHEGVLAQHKQEMFNDPGFLPITVLKAGSSGDKAFSWKNFYGEYLRSAGGPLQSTIGGLRVSVEQTLFYRRTGIFVIDEAVHMLRGASRTTALGHVDALKSLASMVGVTIILVGSYDLAEILAMSGQIARRSTLVHFPRYLQQPGKEGDAFQLALKGMLASFPVEGAVPLLELSSQLHQITHGCVGILKKLFLESLKMAFSDGRQWNRGHLRRALPRAAQLDAMIRETDQGEKLLAKNDFESNAWDVLTKFKASLREEEEDAR